MELIEKTDQQMIDTNDYIDIPAFFRVMALHAFRFAFFLVPMVLIMTGCIALLSKASVKKSYVAGETFLIGIQLSSADYYYYSFPGMTWTRQTVVSRVSSVFSGALSSEYMERCIREDMRLEDGEEINAEIRMSFADGTNLVGLYVVADSQRYAERIRNAVFDHLPETVFSTMGFVELDVKEKFSREMPSSKEFLAYPIVWVAAGIFLGVFAYLGLIFLYSLLVNYIEGPEDMQRITSLSCLGRLPGLQRNRFLRKNDSDKQSLKITDKYKESFTEFRKRLSEEIRDRQIRVLLFTGIPEKRGQTQLIKMLEMDWLAKGKKVTVANLDFEEGAGVEKTIQTYLENASDETDLIMIDSPSFGLSSVPLILADYADAMVFVIKEGYVHREDVKDMFQVMQFAKAVPLGYVLNRCNYYPFGKV